MAGGTPHRHHPSFVMVGNIGIIVGNVAHHRRQRCALSSASLRIIRSVEAARPPAVIGKCFT
jgi:hypothetical protein